MRTIVMTQPSVVEYNQSQSSWSCSERHLKYTHECWPVSNHRSTIVTASTSISPQIWSSTAAITHPAGIRTRRGRGEPCSAIPMEVALFYWPGRKFSTPFSLQSTSKKTIWGLEWHEILITENSEFSESNRPTKCATISRNLLPVPFFSNPELHAQLKIMLTRDFTRERVIVLCYIENPISTSIHVGVCFP